MVDGVLELVEKNDIVDRFAELIFKAKVSLVKAGFTEEQAFELVKSGIVKR